MNILLLSDELMPGGVARHIVDLANSIKKRGVNVYLSTTPGEYKNRLNPEISYLPISILIENSFNKNYWGIIPSYIGLSKYIKKNRIDVIHTHKRYSHLIGKILSKQYGIPHITSYHSDFNSEQKISIFGNITICCSKAVCKTIVEQFGCNENNVKTIYYGIKQFRVYNEKEIEKLHSKHGVR